MNTVRPNDTQKSPLELSATTAVRGREGENLAEQSEHLADPPQEEDPLDTPPGMVTMPVVKTVQATFIYVGKLQPTPVPDLDD